MEGSECISFGWLQVSRGVLDNGCDYNQISLPEGGCLGTPTTYILNFLGLAQNILQTLALVM